MPKLNLSRFEIENLGLRAILALLIFIGSMAAARQLIDSTHWGYWSWSITEWLINYAGGFVRRGLSGELVSFLSHHTGIQANYWAIFLSYASYLFLTLYFFTYSPTIASKCLIISPVVMGAPAYDNSIVRKDALAVCFLVGCLHVLRSKLPLRLKFILLNIIASVAILFHETFGIYGIAAILMFLVCERDESGPLHQRTIRYLLKLSPAVMVFVACVRYHGNYEVATHINSSWQQLWAHIQPDKCCFERPTGAINAIGWSLSKTVSLQRSVLSDFSGWVYVPLAWLATIILCYYFMIALAVHDHRDTEKLAKLLLINFVPFVPLFVLGWDFGRYIFLWTATSYALYLRGFDPNQLPTIGAIRLNNCPLGSHRDNKSIGSAWPLLLIGVPSCCWELSSFFRTSPIGYLFFLYGLI